jgi:hypothetical protein
VHRDVAEHPRDGDRRRRQRPGAARGNHAFRPPARRP